jgi:hypothetical protein
MDFLLKFLWRALNMSIAQPKTDASLKQREYPFWTSCFAIIIGLGVLGYFGYCFGLWGRGSLFLQYLFQCGCPGFSGELRYPGEVDFIMSACEREEIILSPSGRLLMVVPKAGIDGYTTAKVVNLQTNDKTSLRLPDGHSYFLADDLMYIFAYYGYGHEGGDHILDLRTNIMYPIQTFRQWSSNSFINGYADPVKLAESLRSADSIYYIRNERLIVALPQDVARTPEQAFLSSAFDVPDDGDVNRVEPFLQENNLLYEPVYALSGSDIVSPDGRFIARNDGIYLAATDQMIAGSPIERVEGWIYDGRGAIYTGRDCVFLFSLPGLDMSCLAWIDQPVILLKVPEEYLSATPRP